MMMLGNFRVSNGRLITGAGLNRIREVHPVQATLVKATPVVNTSVNVFPAKDVNFESPRRKGTWTLEEDQRLLQAVSEFPVEGTKPWSKIARLVKTRDAQQCMYRWKQCHSGGTFSGKKHRSRLDLCDVMDEAVSLLGNSDGSEELCAAFGRAIGEDPKILDAFAERFLDGVEKMSSSKKTPPPKFERKEPSKRKRRIDFYDNKVLGDDENVEAIGLQDLVDSLKRPAKRFSILVVEKVRQPDTQKKMSYNMNSMLEDPMIKNEKLAVVNMRMKCM